MSQRIQKLSVVAGLSQALHRRLSNDLGGVGRAIRLNVSKTPEFCALPKSLPTGSDEFGQKIMGGDFHFSGQRLVLGEAGSPWDISSPSEKFADRLHRFEWLSDLAANTFEKKRRRKINQTADRELADKARKSAGFLVDDWIENFGKWNPYAWRMDILSARVFSWLINWQVLFENANDRQADKIRRACLYRQLKQIKTRYSWSSAGIERFRAAACLVLGGACFANSSDGFYEKGLDLLDDEIEKQILPDGGHISRSPMAIIDALEILVLVESALIARGVSGSKEIRRAIDRLAPMVGFFNVKKHGLAGFNGGGRGDPKRISAILAQTKISSKPFSYAPHMRYQRLEFNQAVLFLDGGECPPRPYDLDAHLAPLSLEVCTPQGWLFVNCGWNKNQPLRWRQMVRGTSAHSGLVLGGQNVGSLVRNGVAKQIIGAAIDQGSGPVKCTRKDQDYGAWIEGHDRSYVDQFGLEHCRRLFMDAMGQDIRGEDVLSVPVGEYPVTDRRIPFDIRFHLHPDVKVTLAQDQKSALLIQPGGFGWRFRTDCGPLIIEKSVYLAEGERPRRCEQIVITGAAYGDSDGQTRSNRVRWSVKRLGGIDANGFVNG